MTYPGTGHRWWPHVRSREDLHVGAMVVSGLASDVAVGMIWQYIWKRS